MPPQNDVDIFAQDLGFIAIVEDGEITGFNVTAGGGMGMTHGDVATYPRLGDVLGFCRPEDVIAVAEAVVTAQRDLGDRTNRKHARLKYTIDDRGVDEFREEVEQRSGVKLGAPRKFTFVANNDSYGWQRDDTGVWHYSLFIQNGRVSDVGDRRLMSGLRALALRHQVELRLTPNQNLIISKVVDSERESIIATLREFGIENNAQATPLRLNSMACVGFPTCGLAMAESERYLPDLIDRLDAVLADFSLEHAAITTRMTGCANGCARPYIGEIGLVGKGPGRYTLFLGAGHAGERIGYPFLDNANEAEILDALAPLFARYASEREYEEHFGDFLVRAGIVPEIKHGSEIHAG